jgi:hypothetical protein
MNQIIRLRHDANRTAETYRPVLHLEISTTAEPLRARNPKPLQPFFCPLKPIADCKTENARSNDGTPFIIHNSQFAKGNSCRRLNFSQNFEQSIILRYPAWRK